MTPDDMTQDGELMQLEKPSLPSYEGWQEWWLVREFNRKYPYDIPTPGHLQSMATIVEGLGSPWNIPTNWDRCKWYHTAKGGISLNYGGSKLATHDFGALTNLVLAAHRNCVRVEIEACNMNFVKISFWPRDPAGKHTFERHPTLHDLASRAAGGKR
jgi:hypothetical protein